MDKYIKGREMIEINVSVETVESGMSSNLI